MFAPGATFRGTLDLTDSEIVGKVDFSGATFERGLLAPGARFRGIVDLRGAQISGKADMSQARFESPVLLGKRRGTHVTTFAGGADFSLATFSSLAMFEETDFAKGADFTLTSFEANAVFAGGTFEKDARFSRTVFRGPADFSGLTLYSSASFEGSEFQQSADFSQVTFGGGADFHRTRFREGASFVVASFPRNGEARDSFVGLSSDGDLNFGFVTFARKADFSQLVVRGTISFRGSTFPVERGLGFSQESVGAFVMSVDQALRAVRHDQTTDDWPEVLGLIESSATDRNDLATANDAHYQRMVLASQDRRLPVRLLDIVFYRDLAGYFVRPFNPLFALLALAAVATAIRIWRLHNAPDEQDRAPTTSQAVGRAAGVTRGARGAAHGLGNAVLDFGSTLALIGPRRSQDPISRGTQVEILVYRVLFACALIGFANSNPTLRQMLDAIG